MIQHMKRGRPNVRGVIQTTLLNVFTDASTPMTVSSLTRIVSKQVNKQISWNTVQKYLNELIRDDRVQAIALPHSKFDDKNGITVYTLKK